MAKSGIAYGVVILACLISLLPTIYMVDISLRDSVDSFSPVLIAGHHTLDNYAAVLAHGEFAGFFVNSLVVAIGTVILTLLCSTALAYAISRLKVPGGPVILLVVMSAMLLPLDVHVPALPGCEHVMISVGHQRGDLQIHRRRSACHRVGHVGRVLTVDHP